jgi:DNA-binding transcriptional ArsR family regulator
MSRPFVPDPERDLILDATALKALAHPLRNRIIKSLRLHGPATASQLAERLGVNSGATSYHLRQLAEAGMVVDDEERGNARDRWWKAAHERTYFDLAQGDSDAAVAYLSAVAAAYSETLHRAVEELPSLPAEWRDATTLSDYGLVLTAAEAKALLEELQTVVSRYRAREDATQAPHGSRPVSVQLQVIRTPGTGETP